MKVTTEQIQAARRVDLYEFLKNHRPDDVVVEGNSLRLKIDHSVSIRRGYAGYKDFSSGATGNGVDLLVRYFGYTVPQAVAELTGGAPRVTTAAATVQPAVRFIKLPPTAENYRRVFAYLQQQRKIPADVIQRLIDDRLLYQAAETNNAVFVNRNRDFAELRGTLSEKPFHGVLKTSSDRFWHFQGSPTAAGVRPTAYVCESAIDAISLYLLDRMYGRDTAAYYCSIGGAANYDTIDRIRRHANAVLAVDNDHAGDLCRERYPDLPYVLPDKKDWNDDWREPLLII